jgi:mannosylglucosylglycerate synthase
VVGGVEAVVGRHAALLAGAGHRVRIIAGRGRGMSADPGVELVLVPLADARAPRIARLRRSLDAGEVPVAFGDVVDELQDRLATAIEGLDVVVAHNVCSLTLNLALTAALHGLVVRGSAPPLVAWHHDHALASQRETTTALPAGLPWDLLRTVWPGVRHVAVSEARRHDLEAIYGPAAGRILVVPNGIDQDAFLGVSAAGRALLDRLSIDPGAAILLAPARITRRKRLELAIGAVASLRAGIDAHLVVTGPPDPHEGRSEGYAGELVELAGALGISSSVHLLSLEGPSPTAAVIADLYRVADLLVVPSADEGFGLPVLEAGLVRLPIVCTDLPVLRELAGDAGTYIQARAGAAAWAEAIGRVLREDGRVRLRRRIRSSYSWEAIGTTMLEPLLADVAAARR